MQGFCIDFTVGEYGRLVNSDHLEVAEYEPEDLAAELLEWGVSTPEELTDPSWSRVVFSTEEAAEKFLAEYRTTEASLRAEPYGYCEDPKLPALAYYRRMLVFALMGVKLSTRREFLKSNWKPGMLFNLHDRTHFLTVRLTAITREDDEYRYSFELP